MYVQPSNHDPAQSAPAKSATGSPARDSVPVQASNAVGAPEQAAAKAENPNAVRIAVAAINRAAKTLTNTVELVMDERSEQPLVKVMDSETGQLIRQIPSEEVLELRRALERVSGLLINRTA